MKSYLVLLVVVFGISANASEMKCGVISKVEGITTRKVTFRDGNTITFAIGLSDTLLNGFFASERPVCIESDDAGVLKSVSLP